MSDILSGGAIDDSTDGPIPSKVDDRKRDIIAEQKEVQRQDAIGGTEEPPKVSQPEQIPQPSQVAPPLPAIPSFDFNIVGSLAEETREVARQATLDVIKNVTINGQGPSIEGSNISFNIPQERPASEVFVFQGIAMVQPQPVIANNITDVTISPPIEPPATPTQTTQSPQPTQPAQTGEQRRELINEQRDRENAEREARDQAIRLDLGLSAVSPLDKPSETVTPRGEPIGEQRDRENAERARRDREVRESVGLSGEDPMDDDTTMGGHSSSRAYKAAEAKSKAKRESDPDFDRESDIRQRGESPREFRERQEQLKEERQERAQAAKEKSDFLKRAREGDISEAPSGIVPVEFTRADGQRKILAFVATEFVATTEGAVARERTTSLPDESSYYKAGGGDSGCAGLALYTKTVGTPPNTTTQVWVGAGTVNGELPSGFDPIDGKNIANGGSGDVWAEVNINGETGEIISAVVNGGGNTPENTDTSFYYTLGHYQYDGNIPSIMNYGCGGIDVTICRNWFALEAPFYGVSLTRGTMALGGGSDNY